MNFEIVYTDNFERELKKLAKKYPSLKNDIKNLIDSLENNPFFGTSLGLDCYKIRLAIKSKGKGKSGGGRVITYVYVAEKMVYLLSIYDKSQRENVTDKELEMLISQIG